MPTKSPSTRVSLDSDSMTIDMHYHEPLCADCQDEITRSIREEARKLGRDFSVDVQSNHLFVEVRRSVSIDKTHELCDRIESELDFCWTGHEGGPDDDIEI